MDNSTSNDINRCDYYENIVKFCDKEYIFNPENKYKVIKDDAFKPLDSDGSAVQIKPQRIDLKLRLRKLTKINAKFV